MAVTYVQKVAGTGNGTGDTATVTITCTIGNTIYIIIYRSQASGASVISSVVGSVNGAYTLLASASATVVGTHYSHLYIDVYYTTAISGSADVVTVSFDTPVACYCSAFESTPGIPDQVNTASGNSDTASAGSITPSVNGTFSIAATIIDDGFGLGNWFNPGSGWTLGGGSQGGGNSDINDEYRDQAVAAAITGDFVPNFATFAGPWIAVVFDFKPSTPAARYILGTH